MFFYQRLKFLFPKVIKTLVCMGFVFSLSSFYGCSSGNADTSNNKPEDAPYSVTLKQIDQHQRLGKKLADGQFIVIDLGIENLKTEPIKLPISDVSLETVTTDPKEHYTLNPETSYLFDFMGAYGADKSDRMIANDVKLNPRANIERYVIFIIPNNATLDQYQLFIKSYNVRIPLNSQSVVINDYRQKEA